MSDLVPIKRALISVSDKTDLVPFARRLADHGAEIVSTGGTARALEQAGVAVTPVDRLTGFPEMMDGRLKTLHPRVHGGLLALRDNPEHARSMREHGIEPIDLVCVNLYPFEATIAARPDLADAEAIEQIDIGGPSMIRSAAKNHRFVAVVTDPGQYDRVSSELDSQGGATTFALRRSLAAAAFSRTAAYDTAIASWKSSRDPQSAKEGLFPETLILRYGRSDRLRYGENPHQAGARYMGPDPGEASVARARQLHGKELSFCNLYDADGALELVKEIDPSEHAAAAVIKHANPCGFAVAADLPRAFQSAYDGDPVAAFGGIVALNRVVDAATAETIVSVKNFLDVILAPAYDEAALAILRERWKNTRLLEVGEIASPTRRKPGLDFKRITGGLLAHERDLSPFEPATWQHAAGPAPQPPALRQMRLAMIAAKHLKSNAVSLVRGDMLVGAGAGQMDRLTSCRLAVEKAGERARGAAAGSDAFFPFRDGPDILIRAGVTAIAEPGGSKRDEETVAACNEAGVTLMFTGTRHFRH
jgi:phosphoribosylaminoimidazolecarboxamide formyltransferase/IMP cyclohydrolase